MTKRDGLIYLGVGILALLIIHSSTKRVELREVSDSDISQADKGPFDSSKLPADLKPPYRLASGEPIPMPQKRPFSLSSITLKPRFDGYDF